MNISTTIETSKPKSNRGGARPGAGRPKQQHDGETVYELLTRERARHETAKANAKEVENRIRSGELLEKTDVERSAMIMHAALAQFLRSLPDDLERKCALPPPAVEALELAIDAATIEMAERIGDVLKGK